MNVRHFGFAVSLSGALMFASTLVLHADPGLRPGGTWNGRYIGFVPGHEKVKQGLVTSCDGCDSGDCGCNVAAGSNDVVLDGTIVADGVTLDDGTWSDHSFWPAPLFYGRLEFLGWSTRGMKVHTLATSSPLDTPLQEAGVLGLNGTVSRFGPGRLNDDFRAGGRASFGRTLNPELGRGFDITYSGLTEESTSYGANAGQIPILARPFFNTVTEAQDSRLIAYPEIVEGTLSVISSTEFHTVDAVFRQTYAMISCVRAEYFVGYRFARLDDLLQIDERTVSLTGPTLGSTFGLVDQFASRNEFHGGEFGLRWTRQRNACWSFDMSTLIALGSTRSRTVINGQTEITNNNAQTFVTDAGLLTQGTNIGVYEDDKFGGMAEFSLTARRRLNCGLTATLGYTFLYWGEVVRAGEQADLDINVTQIPPGSLEGEPAPVFPDHKTGFWAQGFNLGLEYRY